jgi:hypothetical protein
VRQTGPCTDLREFECQVEEYGLQPEGCRESKKVLEQVYVPQASRFTQLFVRKCEAAQTSQRPGGGEASGGRVSGDMGADETSGIALASHYCPQHGAVPPGEEPTSPRGPWAFSVSLGELKSIRRSKPGLSWAYLVLVTQAGGSLPALHFHRGGTRALLRVLSRYLLLAR